LISPGPLPHDFLFPISPDALTVIFSCLVFSPLLLFRNILYFLFSRGYPECVPARLDVFFPFPMFSPCRFIFHHALRLAFLIVPTLIPCVFFCRSNLFSCLRFVQQPTYGLTNWPLNFLIACTFTFWFYFCFPSF